MGQMYVVRCAACGHVSEILHGVGGDWGYTGDFTVTVACPVDGEFHDTDAGNVRDDPELFDRVVREPLNGVWPKLSGGPCPTCGEMHPAWSPTTGACPKCRSCACEVEVVGMWD